MEGWYYRLTLPEDQGNVSFAFIISIEDPGNDKSHLKLACIQVVGPHDEYLVQADTDDTKFWASKDEQAFGCNFAYNCDQQQQTDQHKYTTSLTKDQWQEQVESGFQVLPNHLIGKVKGHDGTLGGVLEGQGIPGECYFDISIDQVLAGWGDVNATQKSTGGWLASFAVFEPHWQVTLADARVSGTVKWKNSTYNFQNAPLYAEKNWGKALPSKWYWTQCNSFEGYTKDPSKALSVTAGGGIRQVPFGKQEALGMVSVHYQGKFYEAVPWTGTMGWKVDTWGSWVLYGRCTEGDRKFQVEITYQLDPKVTPGLVFRAPTPKEGMVYFCRDTFEAETTLTLWELEYNDDTREWEPKPGPPLIDNAKSKQGGAEVGGGPWWDTWENDSQLKRSFKILLQAPYKIRQLLR
ncbi:tocopherol cyclase [Seminavis robusta]|uniref:Tocopherol cyclase n=1 Tax=Seminavis robusta TaxID=568900 RepID=A0A9N8ESH9_9STRA|nr:tocopherol cyclase [Seminavis robusta]|eukprot:Sro1471_g275440.1 tocopherol cyclase (407) ;mRNA; r:16447-17667